MLGAAVPDRLGFWEERSMVRQYDSGRWVPGKLSLMVCIHASGIPHDSKLRPIAPPSRTI
ncbi:hypothetical protein M407DRAFT_245724, partial [Tulasnella calospora MUT 4182]